jgi:hypothetical protein
MTATLTTPRPTVPSTDRRTLVVHVRDPEGFTEYIGRGMRTNADPRVRARSPWANPWKVGQIVADCSDGRPVALDLPEVLRRYELITLPGIRERFGDAWFAEALAQLAGQRLGCWCADIGTQLTADDPLRCHGQLLARLADGAVR